MNQPPPSAQVRTAFVSGASGGLGQAFAEALLGSGFAVWGTARDAGRLAPLAGRPGFHPLSMDLALADAAAQAFSDAEAEAGGFDVIIQNAGYGLFAPFTDVDEALWEDQVRSMLLTTARLSRLALRGFRARGRGCLVHVSSLAVEFPLPFLSGYNVAKAGLSALSESLMMETRGMGITVIDFRPGDYRTGFNVAMRERLEPAADRNLARVWKRIDDLLAAAPTPDRAARDLLAAIARGRSGVVRSGSFFQAWLAPRLAALAPASWLRASQARYFDLR